MASRRNCRHGFNPVDGPGLWCRGCDRDAKERARKMNKREVCLIYGIPPWLVGPEEPGDRWWWHSRWPLRQWWALRAVLRRA